MDSYKKTTTSNSKSEKVLYRDYLAPLNKRYEIADPSAKRHFPEIAILGHQETVLSRFQGKITSRNLTLEASVRLIDSNHICQMVRIPFTKVIFHTLVTDCNAHAPLVKIRWLTKCLLIAGTYDST